MSVCGYVHLSAVVPRDSRALGPLELELQAAVAQVIVGAGILIWVLWKLSMYS